MQMLLVIRDGLARRRQIRIDDDVVMTGVRLDDPGGCDARAAQSHAQPELAAGDDGAVRRPDDVGVRVLGQAGARRRTGSERNEGARRRNAADAFHWHLPTWIVDPDTAKLQTARNRL